MASTHRFTTVVTGCNRGIGYEIAKGLLQVIPAGNLVLCVRNEEKYNTTVARLKSDLSGVFTDVEKRLAFVPLDLEKNKDIEKFSENIKQALNSTFSSIDILCCNAGFSFTQISDVSAYEQASKTVGINYFGTAKLVERAMLLMTHNTGRVIVTGSNCGYLNNLPSKQLQNELLAPLLTTEQIGAIAHRYLDAIRKQVHVSLGFKDNTYFMSKIFIGTFCRVCGNEPDHNGVTVNGFCPGWCKTDMTLGEGNKTAAEGADTAIWLATSEDVRGISGKFFTERRQVSFFDGSVVKE